jgi:alkaline phosphatase D
MRSGQCLALTLASPYWALGQQAPGKDPFTLGVSSGDPAPDGVVLWTRLAPDPLHGGGMPDERVEVEWQLASDEKMTQIVQRNTAVATPDLAHSVHVEVQGLEPGRWYWYQFKTGPHTSRIGRTRTAPDPRQPLDKLSFAFASCQHYEAGYFTAYKHMAEEDLDVIVHLGDYIYEGGIRDDRPRHHNSDEIVSLNDYRNRHAQYRTDPDLQKAHAMFPWIVTWDDHEVANNYAGAISQNSDPREQFLERRAGAYQAYYEHMPLRRESMPRGSAMKIYRRLAFGDLAEFAVLDTRQYRTDQPCGDGNHPQCAEALSPDGTLLGEEQERWLFDGLRHSERRWNILAQQILMAKVDRGPGAEKAYSMDQWSGYEVARKRLLRFLHDSKVSNPVVISGDIHSNWAADLKLDFDAEKSPVVGPEFVGTSITSGGDGSDSRPEVDAYLPKNPHVHFYNNQRGYVRCQLTPERWTSDYRVVQYVEKPGANVRTRVSFVVENGRPAMQKA